MIEIALSLALFAPTETWSCFIDGRDGAEGYRATYVVIDDKVIEATNGTNSSWHVLQNNQRSLIFAASMHGVDDYTGVPIEQMATIIGISRETDALRRTFVQENGTVVEYVDGRCAKSLI